MDSTLKKILELMAKEGLDNQALAEKLGLNRQVVTDWKAERSKSYTKYLYQIAQIFNVSVNYLNGQIKDEQRNKTPMISESFTEDEKKIILAYRNHPEMHEAVHKILGISEERITMREMFEINFWNSFCYWCNEKNTTKEAVSKAVNVPLNKIEELFQAENTKEYPLLNRIAKYLNVAPDELLGIHPAMVVETDLINARTILLKKDTSSFDSRVIEAFENPSTFSAGLTGYLDYWRGNLSGLAYIADCSINELVGRPRPLSSEVPSQSATIAARGNAELQKAKKPPKTSNNL